MNHPPRDRQSSCEGKHRYATWSAAEAVRRKVSHKIEKGAMHVYACRHCGGFHLGNSAALTQPERRHG